MYRTVPCTPGSVRTWYKLARKRTSRCTGTAYGTNCTVDVPGVHMYLVPRMVFSGGCMQPPEGGFRAHVARYPRHLLRQWALFPYAIYPRSIPPSSNAHHAPGALKCRMVSEGRLTPTNVASNRTTTPCRENPMCVSGWFAKTG